MKKKKIIILIIVVLIIFILTGIIIQIKNSLSNVKNDNNLINSEDNEEQITNDYIISSNNSTIENTQNIIENKIQNQEITRSNTDIESNTKVNSLPNDSGLTINGVEKKFNQDIMAQANIAYLLGCDEILNTTDFEKYINNHLPNNGIWISERTTYKKTDNPYDYIKERKHIMQEMLSSIDLKYNINENNYLINNNNNNNNNNEELQQKLNAIISGNKKIIIGFLPEYYTYIDDSEYGLQLGGGYMNSSYISLKPYNNIYAYIFDENSVNTDDFFSMIEEISQINN